MLAAIEGNYSVAPSMENIYQGKYNATVSLLQVQSCFTLYNTAQYFQFGGLRKNTLYTFFLVGTTDDPSLMSTKSQIKVIQYSTIEEHYIYLQSSQSLLRPVAALLLLLLLLVA